MASSGFETTIKMQFGEYFTAFGDHILHDVVVGVEQVVAAHARLARNTGRDHDDVRVRGVGVVVGPDDERIALLDGHGFEQVEPLALGHAFDDVDQYHIGQLFGGDPVRGSGAHVSRTDYGHFLAHGVSFRWPQEFFTTGENGGHGGAISPPSPPPRPCFR